MSSGREQLQEIEEWGARIERDSKAFAIAVGTLEGCDRVELFLLVSLLAQAVCSRPISRRELQKAIADLKRAQKAIQLIALTDVRELIFGNAFVEEFDLTEEIERAEGLLRLARKDRPILRDVGRAALVRYVRRCTGRWHDDEVSVLIDIAESLEYYASSDKPHRRMLRGAARGDDPSQQGVYTAEAHRQWRVRNSSMIRRKSEWEQLLSGWELS